MELHFFSLVSWVLPWLDIRFLYYGRRVIHNRATEADEKDDSHHEDVYFLNEKRFRVILRAVPGDALFGISIVKIVKEDVWLQRHGESGRRFPEKGMSGSYEDRLTQDGK